MRRSKAIVTLVMGQRYEAMFKAFCEGSWRRYSDKHGYDLLVFDRPLDGSERAARRSPSWQKCLVFGDPAVARYDQVVWIDSDVMINGAAPCICEDVPLESVGAVDAYGFPTPALYRHNLQRLYDYWAAAGIDYVDNLTPEKFYLNFGLSPAHDRVVQAGVMVASPALHRDVFKRAYDNHEDKGEAKWNYEMRPLSHELMNAGVVHWIDSRFNVLWPDQLAMHYPFLLRSGPTLFERIGRRLGLSFPSGMRTRCATAAYHNAFFLHFAGSAWEMRYVDQSTRSVFDIP